VVGKELDGEERETARLVQPARIAGRDVKLVEAVRDVCVVLEVARPFCDAVTPGSMESLAVRKRTKQELRERSRRVEPLRALEHPARLGERGEHQAVPGSDRLVVTERPRPFVSLLQQRDTFLFGEEAADDESTVLERLQQVGARDLVRSPGERESFDAV